MGTEKYNVRLNKSATWQGSLDGMYEEYITSGGGILYDMLLSGAF